MNDRIYQAKFKHLAGLYEEYEIGFNQMANVFDDVMRRKTERGLETKLREIRKYEAKLNIKSEASQIQEESQIHFAFLGAFASKPATFDLAAMATIWLTDAPNHLYAF